MVKPIRRDRDGSGIGVESVDLILQTWSRTEILRISIDSVCEIDVFVLWVNGYIIERVKLATEVIVQENWVNLVSCLFFMLAVGIDTNRSYCMAFAGS